VKKSLIIGLACVCLAMQWGVAQETLLQFAHSRVVAENYNNEMSTRNEVVYYEGSAIVSKQIDCKCERLGDRKIAIEFTREDVPMHILQLRLDLLIVMDAFLSTDAGISGGSRTHSISKLNVQLSNFDFDHLDRLHGVARMTMPTNEGFIGDEQNIYIRFKCANGKTTNLTEGLQIAGSSR